MNISLHQTILSYHQTASKIIGKSNNPQKSLMNHSTSSKPRQRLTLHEIKNITKSMIKDKKAYLNNMGVITNIKGKMYCLKLGQVSKPKQFIHYFYSTQYRKKFRSQVKPYKIL